MKFENGGSIAHAVFKAFAVLLWAAPCVRHSGVIWDLSSDLYDLISKALLYFLGCVLTCTLGCELRIRVGLPTEMYALPYLASIYASILHNHGPLIRTKKLTLIQYCELNCRLYSNFPVFPFMSFFCFRIQSRVPRYI